MSLVIAVKSPEGIVLAADSRLTAVQKREGGIPDMMFLDSGTKIHPLGPPNHSVAIAFFGAAAGGIRSAGSLVAEWGRNQGMRLPLEEIARSLHSWLPTQGIGNIFLYVAGFDETTAFGRIFEVAIPGSVHELSPGTNGISLGGKRELAETVLQKIHPPLDMFPLRSSAHLARWLIELTIEAQGFSLGMPSVGGDVQLALLERNKPIRIVQGGL